MKKTMLIYMLLPAVFISVAHATVSLDYELAKKAIELSATVDAYGAYCQKPSTLGDDYIKRFQEIKVEDKKIDELEKLQKKANQEALDALKAEKKDCKDVKLLLKRLEIMRSLKDVSYQLNGIDPATVKDNIPPLEMLSPDAPSTLPSDVPPEPPQE